MIQNSGAVIMNDPTKRKVLITGGSSGLGLELAKQMAAQGSTVIICGRSQEKLDQAVKQSPQLIAIRCDIASGKERKDLFQTISGSHGDLNMLINNAGIVRRFLFETVNGDDLEEKIDDEWKTNYLAACRT